MPAKACRNHRKICLLLFTSYFFDTSTVVHFHSASLHLPDSYMEPFLFRSIPDPYRSSTKEWFANPLWKAFAIGHTYIPFWYAGYYHLSYSMDNKAVCSISFVTHLAPVWGDCHSKIIGDLYWWKLILNSGFLFTVAFILSYEIRKYLPYEILNLSE